jgi:hypothetical protein
MTLYRPLTEDRLHFWVTAYVILACALATGCRAKRVVTVEQVDAMIKNQLHVGSTKAEVAAFIDSLKIDSLRVIHSDGFLDLGHLRWDNFDEQKVDALGDRLKEFYWAVVEDIAPSTSTFMIRIRMRFYFDQDGKLLDYTIKEDTGFR